MDDKTKTGKADDTRINVHQEHEVQYWTKELEVTREQLEEAVRQVGVMVEDVRRYLNK